MIAVSMNYLLAQWGFLFGQEILDAGATNLALRDQRLALHWVQENIKAFGGNPRKFTIWGENAGAFSVAMQLVAYVGRDDGPFWSAIQQSGGVSVSGRLATVAFSQPAYDSLVKATNCTKVSDTLACLRTVPTDTLSSIFNSSISDGARAVPAVNHVFLRGSGTTLLRHGQFVKVPLLIGANHDEGSTFGMPGLNTTEQFKEMVVSGGPSNGTAETLVALYPNIPEIGIPATLKGPAPPSLGKQWKRSAAYGGDLLIHAQRRLTTQMWSKYNETVWSYGFNVLVNGVPDYMGSSHF